MRPSARNCTWLRPARLGTSGFQRTGFGSTHTCDGDSSQVSMKKSRQRSDSTMNTLARCRQVSTLSRKPRGSPAWNLSKPPPCACSTSGRPARATIEARITLRKVLPREAKWMWKIAGSGDASAVRMTLTARVKAEAFESAEPSRIVGTWRMAAYGVR
ncbi:MAG TPA: hypothetical protein VFP37_08100 [Steroidobacteraceae bacterium]|nr:hypothetical protein [Steroidobacteraceae bacterium]